MNYYNPDEHSSRIWGGVAALLYFLLLLCALIFVRFDFAHPEREDLGILINFGESEVGSGAEDLAATDVASTPPPPTPKVVEQPQELLTDESSDVAMQSSPPKPTPKPTPEVKNTVESTNKPTVETPPVEEQRTVNKNALFPGRTEKSTATSQGTSEDAVGNQGAPTGSPEGAGGGVGGGLIETSFSLNGRSLMGSLPKPNYNSNTTGKVIITVVVNELGAVTSAAYQPQGSTTNSSVLVEAARSAALKAKFSESESILQGGTITYIFKME